MCIRDSARELHDTLLQSAQGLIMVLQARLGRSALSDQDRGVLEKAAERANDLVREGRNRIQGLRAPPASAHELFADLKASSEAIESEGASFQAVLTGTDRAIEHDVKEEMQRIAAEAISNASRHSRARLITLRMEVGERTLTLSVKDDGVGMPQDALPSEGASDHWGITGMRERARRINARLSIVSAPNQGTELRLRVAGSRAFAARKPGSFLAKLLRWRRRDGVDPI